MIEKANDEEVLLDHLKEFRKRFIRVIVFFGVALIVTFMYVPYILDFITLTSNVDVDLNVFSITDPLLLYMKIASIVAFIITFPYILLELSMFIRPALSKMERRFFMRYIPFICLLFFSGVAFAYFVLVPYYVMFSEKLAGNIELNIVMGANKYIDFLSRMLVSFGLVFQLPVLVYILSFVGIISSALLAHVRKYAYFGMMIVAAFLTPPDPVSMGITLIPLGLLYELSIWLCKVNEKRKTLKSEALE